MARNSNCRKNKINSIKKNLEYCLYDISVLRRRLKRGDGNSAIALYCPWIDGRLENIITLLSRLL